ncbi:phosphoribosylanthranilate isomerase [Roseococcus suduntuyensis]|uniref:N-(5'-phosphoribosyl)anthranilate isomerase n=1 Tax=Roseococcus suduntuyensis TaxID=455361 RepID=A0A840AI11_9PROT|nr:phosphoribosylanthranilate isomerase [Roseococcus suduntuyensis]MBB3900120.1 phosphoribosylanthranilate isomerase [Roseococcus suduntuyensis]
MSVWVKVCGIATPEALAAAASAGADEVGFVFFPASPRALTPEQAGALSATLEGGPGRVGLFVDPTDEELAETLAAVPLDTIQLHGEETPARVAEIRARFRRPVMKALGIATEADLAAIPPHAAVADRLLLDAKAPPGAALPGGNAQPFEWRLVRGLAVGRPWLLAGGLTPGNVAEAIATAGAPGVDASSGLERERGVKDSALVAAFVKAARGASV